MEVVKMSEGEFEKQKWRGVYSPAKHIYEMVEKLEVGEALKINRDEWPLKTGLSASIGSKFGPLAKKRFKIRTNLDSSGYIVYRYV